MAFQALITDLNGVTRKFVGDYEYMLVTRRLGDFSEFKVELDVREAAVSEVLIAERALKMYEDGDLRFFGQIWEPLEINEGRAVVVARDPFAGLQWRRVRAGVTYTNEDAGAIVYERLALQNGYRDTFLAGQASITRDGTFSDDSAVVTGLSQTNDLRAGMGVSGEVVALDDGATTLHIESVDSSSQITLTARVSIAGAKSANAASGNPTFTGISDTTDLAEGMVASGTHVTGGSVIVSKTANSVTLSAGATGTGATTISFSADATQTLEFTENASVNRTITYDAGKREDEIVKELSAMSDGFFFRVDPLDDTSGKMGTLRVLYPDAGISRQEVRFGYGADTVDNLSGFRRMEMLPVTRYTAASQDTDGGRIAAAAENTDAIEQYGLFEDEVAFTDVADTTLLQAAADAGTKPTPPLTLELTPNVNAPLLYSDFDVGDFVRLNIRHGQLSILTWVRVIEATLRIDKQGTATLDSVIVETLSGARANQDPARLFRDQLDGNRRRIEALERRVQEITTTAAAAPAPPSESGGGGGSSAPPVDSAPPPPPPSAPPPPPVITSLVAEGLNYRDDSGLHRGILITVGVDFHGQSGDVTIGTIGSDNAAHIGGSGQVFLTRGAGGYTVLVSAQTSAGQVGASTGATVPAVTQE